MKRKRKWKRRKSGSKSAAPVAHDWAACGWFLPASGISLGDQVGWELWPIAADPPLFVLALSELLPADANLSLEADTASMAVEVRKFLEDRPAPRVQNVEPGSTSGATKAWHLAATLENLAKLANFFEHHAGPEICEHFHAYSPEGMLLQWYDSFCQIPLYLSREIPEPRVATFCRLIGGRYNPYAYEE